MRERRLELMILALLALPASLARADVAPPQPEDVSCPRGAVATVPTVRPDALDPRGRPIHPWPYCAASTCRSDADCTGGRTCSSEEIGLCVEDLEVPGGDPVRSVRERGCEPDGTCLRVGAACERARRCVLPEVEAETAATDEAEDQPAAQSPPAESTATQMGCGCRATGGGSASWLALLAPLALFALRRSRLR